MTQDDHFVIAILEMCTDPELSKRFCEVKAEKLTWEKLKDVAEVYESYDLQQQGHDDQFQRKELEKKSEHTLLHHEQRKAVLEMQQKRAQHKRMQDGQR